MVDHQHQSSSRDAAITIPIPSSARQMAEAFAAQQPTTTQADRIRRNTLAVWAVHHYLTWLDIATDLTAGDSWNPLLRAAEDVADLVLPGLGRLECRPLAPDDRQVVLPEAVQTDRIAYVAVELSTDLTEASILGFMPSLDVADPEPILQRHQLRSRDELIDHLFRLEVLPQLLSDLDMSLSAEIQAEVVAQLERVFLLEKDVMWGIKGERAVADVLDRHQTAELREFANSRETGLPDDRRQRQKLIQAVLRKLAQVCEESL